MRKIFLESERLSFSNWTKNDYELAKELWGNDEVARFISANSHFTDEEIEKRLEHGVIGHGNFGQHVFLDILQVGVSIGVDILLGGGISVGVLVLGAVAGASTQKQRKAQQQEKGANNFGTFHTNSPSCKTGCCQKYGSWCHQNAIQRHIWFRGLCKTSRGS